ncbi:hypothetical protein BWI96_11810 [Siphonobacter sp. SORGH_AS_0500]|uniref:tape measure protein n=1 Tax=Siphonobacter sp. SORGH_AS_0500 TaxID=1864824 RepID=UPI000CA9A904|nr:tape measure protein [Siphonobacter sp. SORGH_AS_0500]PKK36533.1 hypothetical protein BWI96_11810 [Siphonobacter sp. SORGH_AS_0500]
MSAIIRPDDLYSQSEFEQALLALQNSHAGLSKSIQADVKRTAKEYLSLKQQLKDIAAAADKIQLGAGAMKQLVELNKKVEETADQHNKAKEKIKELNDTLRANGDFVDNAKEAVKRLQNEIRELSKSGETERQTITKLNNELRQYQTAIKVVETAQKQAKQSIDSTRASYSQLNKETNELTGKLRSVDSALKSSTGAVNRYNKEASTLQTQIQSNTKVLKVLNAETGSSRSLFEGYSGSLRKVNSSVSPVVGSLMSLSATLIGVGSAMEAVTASARIIATMERQNLALRNASSSTSEFNTNLELTRRIALRTGAPLDDTVDALRKFTGAVRGTSLEGEKARRVFTAFSNAFTANGASAEELSRATKALSDMMSKGTVSAEELKGQLGDALPGAVKLFADAMGVSQRELLKMMENGELLAEEVLPKVAAQLEKITGSKAQENLKTISGSWQVVRTNFQLFLAEFNKTGVISNFFSVLNGNLAKYLDALRLSYKNGGLMGITNLMGMSITDALTGNQFNVSGNYYRSLQAKESIEKNHDSFAQATPAQQAQAIKMQTKAVEDQKKKVADLQKTVDKLKSGYKDTWADGGKSYRIWSENINKARKDLNEAKGTLESYTNGLIKMGRVQAETAKKIPALGKPLDKTTPDTMTSSIRDQIDAIPNALIGKNGKAELTKEQTKALKAARDEVLQLYNTLSKGEVARLNLASLKNELNELLYGRKENKSGASAAQKELRKQFTTIQGFIKDYQDELQKFVLNGDNWDVLEAIRKRLQESMPKLEKEMGKGDQKAKTLLGKITDTFRNKMPWLKPLEYDTDTVFGQALKDGEKFRKFIEDKGFTNALKKIQKEVFGDSTKFREQAANAIKPGGGLAERVSERAGKQSDIYMQYQQESGFLKSELNMYILIKNSERAILQDHLDKIYQYELAGDHKMAQLERNAYERRKKQILDEAHIKQQTVEESLQLATTIASGVFEVMSAYRQKELDALSKQKEHELGLAGDNKNAQAKINKEFEKKEAAIKLKQAKADKDNALFQIAVNTAINASRYLPTNPLFYVALASGAVQAAIVLAKPLPQFFKGTNYSPEGPAMVAEYGPELIQGPKGDMRIVSEPSIVNLEKGSKVKTAFETSQLLKRMEDAELMRAIGPGHWQRKIDEIETLRHQNDFNRLVSAMKQSSLSEAMVERAFARALDSRPEKGVIMDAKGYREYEIKQKQKAEYLSRKTGF